MGSEKELVVQKTALSLMLYFPCELFDDGFFVGFAEADFGTIRNFVNSSQETYMQVF